MTAEPPTMPEIMEGVPNTGTTTYITPILAPATGTEADVCADIAERQRKGIAKYQTTVRDNKLTRKEWLRHAYEEALDLAVYLKRLMEDEK